MNKEKLGKVGGQAVIEGVMMQSQDYKAVAVRKSNGEIEVKKEKIDYISIDATPIYNLINNTKYKMIQYKVLIEEVSKEDTTWIKEKLS